MQYLYDKKQTVIFAPQNFNTNQTKKNKKMAVKVRLQRNGRKGYAYYHIVIADSRVSRNGKFIERIGSYNPNTNPATVDLNFERALDWVLKGAQPTDTVRNILSNEGVYMKKHLLGGVQKGAFDEAKAEEKFNAWKQEKEAKLAQLKGKLAQDSKAKAKAKIDAEIAANKQKEAELAKKKAEALAAAEAAAKEAAAEETEAEAPATEEAAPAAE